MRRIADLYIAGCIVAVALSAGAVMRFQLGFGWDTTGLLSLGLLLALLILQMQTGRTRERERLSADLARIGGQLGRLVEDLANLDRRVSGLESAGARRPGRELEPVIAEIEVIGTLVRQVVETVADLEQRAAQGMAPRASAIPAAPPARVAPPPAAPPAPEPPRALDENPLVPKRFAHLGEAGLAEEVRRAVEAGRIEIYLQPVVTLPQRRIRFYEALTRLRTEDGETLYPADYIGIAEKTGVLAVLDQEIVVRAVQILRRLSARSKDVGLFCNVSLASFADGRFARELVAVLEANRALADSLVLEVSQRGLKQGGPIEFETLRSLQGLGYRFSIDQVTDLKSSFQLLADRGFRFAKISCDRLLNRMDELATDIHPADLANYFARFGIELVIDRIETEPQVVDVLDYGVRYGQGFVFSPPRPVRSEVLQTAEPEPAAAAPSRPAAAPAGRPVPPGGRAGAGEPRPAEPRNPADPRRSALGRAILQRQ
ncbi:EAL domain-containing protein [Prosthecomicrobium sp. N25]|uniref:EAL domain-containing protein n=1 Tax=Prosthecomicrobium sp. N25 TaxID=3129254 RepID=UPI0030785739